MKSQPKVSIIVPCYGVEKYLNQCVMSLVEQSLKNIEIILIDDESPDRVPQMCDEWVMKSINGDSKNGHPLPLIKVVHKKNAGLGMACNSGIEIATGEYIAFCDSDDYVDSVMYESMFKVAEEYNCDAVYTGLKRVNNAGEDLGSLQHYNKFLYVEGKGKLNSFINDMIASEPSCSNERIMQVSAKVVLYRRNIIEENNIRFVSEREYPSEDLLFNINYLAHCNSICVLPDFYYNYRDNQSSISHKVNLYKFEKFKKLYYYTLLECNNLSLFDYKERVQRMFLGYIRSYILQIVKSHETIKKQVEVIRHICQDEIWEEIEKDYPIDIMPMHHKLFTWAIVRRRTALIMILSKLK